MAVKYDDECNCGKTHERVKFLGRAKFLIKIKGKKIFPSELEEIFGKFPETLEAKFSMVRYEHEPLQILKIRAVYDKSKTKNPDELKNKLENEIEKAFGIPVEIEWVDYSELPIVFHKINRIIDLTTKS